MEDGDGGGGVGLMLLAGRFFVAARDRYSHFLPTIACPVASLIEYAIASRSRGLPARLIPLHIQSGNRGYYMREDMTEFWA